jgi:hypothetical protein
MGLVRSSTLYLQSPYFHQLDLLDQEVALLVALRVCPAVLVCLVPRQIRAFVMLQLLLRLDFREALADRKKSVDSDFDSDFALSISEHSPQSQSLLLPPSKSYVTTPSHIWHTRRLGSVTVLARCLGTQTSQCHSLGALSKGRSSSLQSRLFRVSSPSSPPLFSVGSVLEHAPCVWLCKYNILSHCFLLYFTIHQA